MLHELSDEDKELYFTPVCIDSYETLTFLTLEWGRSFDPCGGQYWLGTGVLAPHPEETSLELWDFFSSFLHL